MSRVVFSFKKKGEEKTIITAGPYFRWLDIKNVLDNTFKRMKLDLENVSYSLPRVRNQNNYK